ncbi:MAG: winged helix-turn-helix domain-containing protein [Vicinamibacterales bacterium]
MRDDETGAGGAFVRFGVFEFEPVTGELRRNGRTVALQPQPSRVLAVLLERPGDVVPREALRERIWGSETFVDFERGLNFAVAQVRQALGDSATSPRFVQTLPKRGYRFIAPVDTVAPATASSPADDQPPVPSPVAPSAPTATTARFDARGAGGRVAAALAGVTLVGVAVAGVLAWRETRERGAAAPPLRLAVARFDNDTSRPDDEPFVRGIRDVAVAELTARGQGVVSVIGNADVLASPRDTRRLPEIGRALEAPLVVLGQVQHDGNRVRVVAHLIETASQRHVWARPFETASDDPFAAQRELGNAIAAGVTEQIRALRADPAQAGR